MNASDHALRTGGASIALIMAMASLSAFFCALLLLVLLG